MKRITDKPWFGKKRIGWGFKPISTEGRLVTLFFIGVILADLAYFKYTKTGLAMVAVDIVLFAVIARLTSDRPGTDPADQQGDRQGKQK